MGMTIPEELKAMEARLKNQGIKVQEFCEHVNIHRSTWTRWKAGTTIPSVVTWERVRSVYGVLIKG